MAGRAIGLQLAGNSVQSTYRRWLLMCRCMQHKLQMVAAALPGCRGLWT